MKRFWHERPVDPRGQRARPDRRDSGSARLLPCPSLHRPPRGLFGAHSGSLCRRLLPASARPRAPGCPGSLRSPDALSFIVPTAWKVGDVIEKDTVDATARYLHRPRAISCVAYLRDDPDLCFRMSTRTTTSSTELHAIYLPQPRSRRLIRLRSHLSSTHPRILHRLGLPNDWQNAETWDLIGIIFTALLPDAHRDVPRTVGHPQRKGLPPWAAFCRIRGRHLRRRP